MTVRTLKLHVKFDSVYSFKLRVILRFEDRQNMTSRLVAYIINSFTAILIYAQPLKGYNADFFTYFNIFEGLKVPNYCFQASNRLRNCHGKVQ
jgi:hypothetical protein